MRAIEFRQFVKGRFHYWGMFPEGCFTGPISPIIPSQQFTGLFDRNGKEIFEGDIVKREDHIEPIMGIRYHGGGFCYSRKRRSSGPDWQADKDGYVNLLSDLGMCEVIGNIYEQPELMEAKG